MIIFNILFSSTTIVYRWSRVGYRVVCLQCSLSSCGESLASSELPTRRSETDLRSEILRSNKEDWVTITITKSELPTRRSETDPRPEIIRRSGFR